MFKDVNIVIPKSHGHLPGDFIEFAIPKGKLGRLLAPLYLFCALWSQKPDLVIMHDPELLPMLIIFTIWYRVPIIYDVHEDYPNFFLQKEYLNRLTKKSAVLIYRFFEKIAYKIFAGFIFADHFTRDLYFRGRQKTIVIYNFPRVSSVPQLAKKFDLIYPGTLHSGLHARLLNIAKELDSRSMRVSFCIIGKKPSQDVMDDIERIRSQLSFVTIHFDHDLSFDLVQELMAQAKIGLIPLPPTAKYKNNIPTKMFEYMMHGLPQIGTDIPSISFFYQHLQSGFCIDEKNYAVDYADKINTILTNYDDYRKVAQKESALWLTKWCWKNEEIKLISFIRNRLGLDN